MKNSFLLSPESFSGASGSPSEAPRSSLTRRAFVKRAGGATLASVIAFQLSERSHAVEEGEGLSDDEGESEGSTPGSDGPYWDMNCGSPNASGDNVSYNGNVTIGTRAVTIAYDLATLKLEDDGHYNEDSPTHRAKVDITIAGLAGKSYQVNSVFKVTCPRNSGNITSVYGQPGSTPNYTVTDTFQIDQFNCYILLQAVPGAGGATVTSVGVLIFSWTHPTNSALNGIYVIPAGGATNPTITNTYSPHQHL